MELIEAIRERHAVREYSDRPLEGEVLEELKAYIAECNQESGLHMQLVVDEPRAFAGNKAHYGKFSGVKNYIAMVGKKSKAAQEACGYYGEKIVLKAQQMGLNTCWVGITFDVVRGTFTLGYNEKLYLVIAIGYGETAGQPHKGKEFNQVTKIAKNEVAPEWFRKGVEAALLAPTGMNMQRFKFVYNDNHITLKSGMGFFTRIDTGIVKLHFEIGSEKQMDWAAGVPVGDAPAAASTEETAPAAE